MAQAGNGGGKTGGGRQAEQRAKVLGLACGHIQAARIRGEASGVGRVAAGGGDAAVRGALAPGVLQPTRALQPERGGGGGGAQRRGRAHRPAHDGGVKMVVRAQRRRERASRDGRGHARDGAGRGEARWRGAFRRLGPERQAAPQAGVRVAGLRGGAGDAAVIARRGRAVAAGGGCQTSTSTSTGVRATTTRPGDNAQGIASKGNLFGGPTGTRMTF